MPPGSLGPEKVRFALKTQHFYSFLDSADLCQFVWGPAWTLYGPQETLDFVRAATGWDFSLEEALTTGERGTNLARVFNAREGFTRQDDRLPERFFQPMENGVLAGQAYPREDFERALTQLYTLKGWAPETGRPLRARLEALSLGWAADLLEAVPQP